MQIFVLPQKYVETSPTLRPPYFRVLRRVSAAQGERGRHSVWLRNNEVQRILAMPVLRVACRDRVCVYDSAPRHAHNNISKFRGI